MEVRVDQAWHEKLATKLYNLLTLFGGVRVLHRDDPVLLDRDRPTFAALTIMAIENDRIIQAEAIGIHTYFQSCRPATMKELRLLYGCAIALWSSRNKWTTHRKSELPGECLRWGTVMPVKPRLLLYLSDAPLFTHFSGSDRRTGRFTG